jgi:hypothetical protein
VERHDPVAVRAADRQRVTPGRLAQPALVLRAERDLSEAGPVHDRAAAPERARLVHDLRDTRRGDAHDHGVRHAGQLGQ